MFELNKIYKDGYGNEMRVVYISPNPKITYPIVAVNTETSVPHTYTLDGTHYLGNPTSLSNLIPKPQPGEIWAEADRPHILYHIFKSPETGSLMAVDAKYTALFVLDGPCGSILNLDTRHVQ